jgi:hypothetical protein
MAEAWLSSPRWLWAVLGGLLALCLTWAGDAGAQDTDLDVRFRQITPDEGARLKANLATPLDTQARRADLEKQVNLQCIAAKRLPIPEQ